MDFSTKISQDVYNYVRMLPTIPTLQDKIAMRVMSFGELAAEFDLVFVEVAGFLQPIPAENAQAICEVLEVSIVYADVGVKTHNYVEIEVSAAESRDMSEFDVNEADPFFIEGYSEFDEMVDTPFKWWERESFTKPVCLYCNHRDCQC